MLMILNGQECDVTPVGNNMSTRQVRKPDGKLVYHARGPHNPVWYYDDEDAQIHNNDPGLYAEDWMSPSVGAMRLKKGNMFAGYRLHPVKTFGLRPSWCQKANNISIEFSIAKYYLDGQEILIDYNDVEVLSPIAVRAGNLVAMSCRQFGRSLFKCFNSVTDFNIPITVHLRGCYVEEVGGEFVFRSNADNRFICKFALPKLIGTDLEPLKDADGRPYTGLVGHSLTNQTNGTLLYEKFSTPAFAAVVDSLPADFYVDVDTVYSDAADGYVDYLGTGGASWSTVRNAVTGTNINTTGTYCEALSSYGSGNYKVQRVFLKFDLTSFSGAYAYKLKAYGAFYAHTGVSVFTTSGIGASLALADYDASASEIGSSTWSINTYNSIELGNTLDAELGGPVWLCARERDYDVADVAPTIIRRNGMYLADNSGTANDPYLELSPPPTFTPRVIFI